MGLLDADSNAARAGSKTNGSCSATNAPNRLATPDSLEMSAELRIPVRFYASFEETQKGTIKPGMLADLVVIDRDLRSIPPDQIRAAKVLRTIVNGKQVFSQSPR